MPRLTKLYTRSGDDGTTALGGGQRVDKDSLRVQLYGTVDELNSHIGAALAAGLGQRLQDSLRAIQNELFHLGADLCFLEEDKVHYTPPQVEQRHVDSLEETIDELTAVVGALENFILPGGSLGASHLHVARTVCRRAERDAISLAGREAVSPVAIRYLNRLSDALFVMARFENHHKGVDEPLWDPAV